MTASVASRPQTATLAAFAALIVLVGANYVAIRATTLELSPFWGGAVRFVLGALLFAAILGLRRIPLPRGRAFGAAVLYGVLGFSIPFGLIYWAAVEAPAGLATTVMAMVPLITLGFAIGHRLERLRLRAVAGAILALAGIAVAYGGVRIDVSALSVVALVGAAASFAETNIVAKRLPPMHPVAANLIGTATCAITLLAMSVLTGEARRLPTQPATIAAIGYLVTLGTVAIFLLFLFVIRRLPASVVAYEFVLAPIVTVVLAAPLLGEQITTAYLAGAVLVIAGVYVGVLAPDRQRPAVVAEGT